MNQLTLVARIKAKPGREDDLERTLRDLVAPTRVEEGCLAYDLHVDNEDKGHFVFIETWASTPLWQAHMQAPHLQAFQARTDELVADWKLHQLTKIESD